MIETLVEVTETNATSGSTNFARDLNTTNSIVASAVQYLIENINVGSDSPTLLELNEVATSYFIERKGDICFVLM